VQPTRDVLVQELALAQEQEPPAGTVDLAQVVRGEQDRRRLRVLREQLDDLAAPGRIETLGRLVEDPHADLRRERLYWRTRDPSGRPKRPAISAARACASGSRPRSSQARCARPESSP
jgi:hypothetical protein